MSNTSKPTSLPLPPPSRPTNPPRGSSASSGQSHQTGVIKEHWNDLPSNFTPTTSRSVSRTGTPLSRLGGGSDLNTPTTTDGGSITELDFDEILDTLLKAPSKLKPKDVETLGTKVKKSVDTITADQKAELGAVIRKVVVERSEDAAWGRENIVAFMLREKGVSGWAIAVRKILENVV